MTIRKIIFVVYMVAALMFTFLANAQTIRDRVRERREAREQQVNPNYPAKGDLALARKIELTFNGVRRNYLIEAPKGPGPFPVVILLHGGTGSAEEVWRQTSLPTLTRSEGFIVVAPNGLNKHWNDGRGTTLCGVASTADDLGFLKRVIADVIAKEKGNPNAVFMTGVSNGGIMTMHFACMAVSLLRAASYIASTLPAADEEHCSATDAVACDEWDCRPYYFF